MGTSVDRVGNNTYAAAVAEVVRRYQEIQGLTVLGLSNRTLIPNSTLQRRLAGQSFTADELSRVAEVFGITASQILVEAETAAA